MAHQRNTDRLNAYLYFFFVIIIRDSNPEGIGVNETVRWTVE